MFCKDCHYNLAGRLQATCPECGRNYDPGNPDTYMLRELTPWKRVAAVCITWLMLTMLLGMVVSILIATVATLTGL